MKSDCRNTIFKLTLKKDDHSLYTSFEEAMLEIHIYENGHAIVKGTKKSKLVRFFYYDSTFLVSSSASWDINERSKNRAPGVNKHGLPLCIYVSIYELAQSLIGEKKLKVTIVSEDLAIQDLQHLEVTLYGFESTKKLDQDLQENKNQQREPKISANKISTGQYKICSGDTFWGLERRFHLQPGDLQKFNPDVDHQNLQIGQIINLNEKVVDVRGINLISVPDSSKETEGDFPYEGPIEVEDNTLTEIQAKLFKRSWNLGAAAAVKGSTGDFWLNKGIPFFIGSVMIVPIASVAPIAALHIALNASAQYIGNDGKVNFVSALTAGLPLGKFGVNNDYQAALIKGAIANSADFTYDFKKGEFVQIRSILDDKPMDEFVLGTAVSFIFSTKTPYLKKSVEGANTQFFVEIFIGTEGTIVGKKIKDTLKDTYLDKTKTKTDTSENYDIEKALP